jgi:hypothetical protein
MPMMLAIALVAAAPLQPSSASVDATNARFQGLETRLQGAIQLKNAADIEALIASDFALRTAFEGKAPQVMNRSETLTAAASYYRLESFEIRYLAARQLGDAAVVNYRAFHEAALGSLERSGEFVITDVWTKAGSDWKLTLRYVSRPEAPAAKP